MKRWFLCLLVLGIVVASSGCGDDVSPKKALDKISDTLMSETEDKAWNVDESRGYYLDESAYPAMSGTQPEAALAEAYFTQNGQLCLNLLISNGTDKVMQINALDIQAFDYATGEQFAGGVVTLEEELVIEVAGVEAYTVYIAPEHVLKGEDYKLPESVSLTIYFDSEPIVTE